MKNILIDLGCHKFEGLNKLLNDNIIDHTFFVHAYEANPYVFEESNLNKKMFNFANFEHYNEAVTNYDGEIVLNLDQTNKSQGCNILPEPPSEDVLWKTKYEWKHIKIPCVSIKNVLSRCDIKPDDNLIIKCDIEGSEFDVLKMLLVDCHLTNVTKILVEWHERFWFPNHSIKIKQKEELISKFKEQNIILEYWE